MKKTLLFLLIGFLTVCNLSAQLNLAPKAYEILPRTKEEVATFKRTSTIQTNFPKIKFVANEDDPIADGYCRVVLTVGDVWGDGSGYQMLISSNPDAADEFLALFGAPETYDSFEYKIPENAAGDLNTNNIIFNGSEQIDIPAGTYYFGFPNPTPEQMYLAENAFFSWDFQAKTTCSFTIELDTKTRVDVVSMDVFAYNFPSEIKDFTATPAIDNSLSCELSWTNPTLDVMNKPLDDLLSVVIARNDEIIHTISNPTMGASETWTDNPSISGYYTYSIYGVSSTSAGPKYTIEGILVGDDPCKNPLTTYPYLENFEKEKLPYCWEIVDLDGDGQNAWEVNNALGANNSEYSIRHRDLFGVQDNWLILPYMSIPNQNNVVLAFSELIAMPNYYVKNSILVSTGSSNPADGDFVELWTIDKEDVTDQWKEHMVSLEDYAGKDIYIAFRYEGRFAHWWYLDEIEVKELQPLTDMEIVSISSPQSGLDLSQETVSLKLRNVGNQDVQSTKISIYVDNQLKLEHTITETIPAFSNYTYTFDNTLNLSEVKTYQIKATVEVIGDTNVKNNSMTIDVRNYGAIAVMGLANKVTTCDIMFYDDGVEEEYVYEMQKTYTMTFFPAEKGKRLSVEFFELELTDGYTIPDPSGELKFPGDSLHIYEGQIIEDKYKLASLGGFLDYDATRTFESRAADGALTFVFKKEGYQETLMGWEAQVKCYTPDAKEVAIAEILSPIKGGNATSEVTIRVHNYGGETIDIVPVACSINGNAPVIENATLNITPGLSAEYTFNKRIDLSAYGDYEIEVYTLLEGDADPLNDFMSFSFFYRAPVEVYAFSSYFSSTIVSFSSNAPDQTTWKNEINFGYGTFPFGVFYFDEHVYVVTIDVQYNPMYTREIIKYTTDFVEVSRIQVDVQVPFVGVTYDYQTEIVYGSTMNTTTMSSELYTLNIETGEMTLIGAMGEYIGGIACNLYGELYGITSGGKLVLINKTDASLTTLHQLPISNLSMGFQSLTFDLESGRLFNNNYPGVGFCEIDIPTGRVLASGNIADGGMSYVGMYIPFDGDVSIPNVNGQEFAIYPNPTYGEVNIQDLPENAMLTLRNISGSVVDQRYANGNTRFEYQVPSGIYLLEIKHDGKIINNKLIVK